MVVADKSVHALANHAKAFLNHLLKCPANAHDFAYGFHRRTNLAANTGKLGQVPTRNLANHVVEARGDIGGVGSAHLAYLVEGIAESYLGGDEGEGVTGGFRSEGGGAGEAGVDFRLYFYEKQM